MRAGYDLEFKRMVTYAHERALLRVGLLHQQGITPSNLLAMTSALSTPGSTQGSKHAELVALDRYGRRVG